MPSALETLVKILKLEREQGYKDSAVIGGLGAFAQKWQDDAHAQARRPEHHDLVDELVAQMIAYEPLPDRQKRHESIKHMLGRITGRIAPPSSTAESTGPPQVASPKHKPKPARSTPPARTQHKEKRAEKRRHKKRTARPSKKPARIESEPTEPVGPKPKPRRKPRAPLPIEEATATLRGLDAPVEVVEGVGPKIAEKLSKLGIQSVFDLLLHLPRRYDDYTRLLPINKSEPGTLATLIGTIRNSVVLKGRNQRDYLQVTLDDGTGTLNVFFFGQPYLRGKLTRGTQIVVSGKVERSLGRLSMANPEWELLEYDNLHTRAIVPIYPLTEGITSRTMRRILKSTVDYWAERLPDYMPESVMERAQLVELGWALHQIHFPENWNYLAYARERFAFDELFLLQMRVLGRRRAWQAVPGNALAVEDSWLTSTLASLPFTLTDAQQRALGDLRADMARDIPMNRLLQGDVGSGKTVLAALGMAIATHNGYQAALMAPTSILAEQHYQSISQLLATMPPEQEIVVRLLTGATPQAERETTLSGLADGSVHVVIGTHALIQGGVEFNNLAFAVIDEQHRFGVGQRGVLRGKGTNPHLLVMTATPIPRTLALTIHADLDLSVIDELPPGRTPVETHLLTEQERERAYVLINAEIDKGCQAFIIYPLVESDDQVRASQAAVNEYERLSREIFPKRRLGLLHGQRSADEKEAVMAAMNAGELDILVSTSVVEVGIDISNASVILVESANRFGLAQLHQFRGRVGRGEHHSYCLLVSDASIGDAQERLQAVARTTDGFALAEIDFKLRGAGDLLGTRQSGIQSLLRFGDDMSQALVVLAQREARTLYEEDPVLEFPEHQLLAERVAMTSAPETDLS